jgi:predicted CXXCH cytochrome family protein
MDFTRANTYALSIFLMLLLSVPLAAGAMETEDCLACHSDPDFVGEELAIDEESFMHSVHADFGCAACHNSVTDEHPYDGEAVSSMSCTVCHDGIAEEYQQTTHADYADCTDCHKPHRAQGLKTTSAQAMNTPCFQCHDSGDIIVGHSEWLPQTELHVAKVPCITCHTATESFQVVLQIDRKEIEAEEGSGHFRPASYSELKTLSGDKPVRELIDTDMDNIVSLNELRAFKKNPNLKELNISGTLVPRAASHSLATQENRYDCTFCHAAGTQSMQSSVLAVPNKNGSIARLAVEEGSILDTLYGSTDFYLTGSSRSPILDILGLIIICSGFIMPVGHGALRLLTRKNRKH